MLASEPIRCRRLGVLAALMMAMTGASAQAQTDATERANRMAYEASIKCYVAHALAARSKAKQQDLEGARVERASARRAYDLAFQFGERLGHMDSVVDAALDSAEGREAPKMLTSEGYHRQVIAACVATGFR